MVRRLEHGGVAWTEAIVGARVSATCTVVVSSSAWAAASMTAGCTAGRAHTLRKR